MHASFLTNIIMQYISIDSACSEAKLNIKSHAELAMKTTDWPLLALYHAEPKIYRPHIYGHSYNVYPY